MRRILEAVSGLGLALAAGGAGLVWFVGQGRLHVALQRLTSKDATTEDLDATLAVADFLGDSDLDLREAWRKNSAPRSALTDQAVRHLEEVRVLLSKLDRFNKLALAVAGGMVAGGYGRPDRILRDASNWSTLLCAAGLVSVIGAFSSVFQRYHDSAYDNEDWRLPDGHVLARLYPERFYQLGTICWLVVWLVGARTVLQAGDNIGAAKDLAQQKLFSHRT